MYSSLKEMTGYSRTRRVLLSKLVNILIGDEDGFFSIAIINNRASIDASRPI